MVSSGEVGQPATADDLVRPDIADDLVSPDIADDLESCCTGAVTGGVQ